MKRMQWIFLKVLKFLQVLTIVQSLSYTGPEYWEPPGCSMKSFIET